MLCPCLVVAPHSKPVPRCGWVCMMGGQRINVVELIYLIFRTVGFVGKHCLQYFGEPETAFPR